MARLHILLILFFALVAQGHAQKKFSVSGRVLDASTNEPLLFASIIVEGTVYGTTSDLNGYFTLALDTNQCILLCSYVGYNEQKIPLSLTQDVFQTIKLVSFDVMMQDVTVYAYQSSDMEALKGSALSLQSENIKSSTAILPDVLRSVQMLPGVSTNNEFSAKFNH